MFSTLARKRHVLLIPLFFLVAPFLAHAALIDINTASESELESLPGIGPSKAAAVIQYRTENGSFASIADIQHVSGIGPSTYAEIEPYITVSGGSAEQTDSESADTATGTPSVSGGSASPYVPPPASLVVTAPPDSAAYLDVPLAFSAGVTTGSGADVPGVSISWNFGDGSTQSGDPVTKTYRYSGTYLVTVIARDGSVSARDSFTVVVSAASVRIVAVTGDGVTIANDTAMPLDLSGWRLSAGGSSFRFPDGSVIMASSSVLYPDAVTNLPVVFPTELQFPDGMLAAEYSLAPPMKPSAPPARTNEVNGVDTVGNVTSPAHENPAVEAPAAATGTSAAAGAVSVSTDTPPVAAVAASGALSGLAHSPWTLGVLGVLAVAGGAFLVL